MYFSLLHDLCNDVVSVVVGVQSSSLVLVLRESVVSFEVLTAVNVKSFIFWDKRR